MTTNMNLIVPTVGQEPGPDWATDINADLGILDQHDHSSGSGVQITPAGININTDFSINSHNLTTVKTVNFSNQSASLAGTAPNLGCVYVAGGELYYNDEAGNVVKITNSGNVNAGAGSITGLPSGTASASYSSGTFVFQSATSTPANMDVGSLIIRNVTANSKGLTISPPNALGADYSLVMPPTNSAGSTVFLTYDTSNNIGATVVLPLTGTNIANATITGSKIASATITGSNIASATITATNIATGTITNTQIAAATIGVEKLIAMPVAATPGQNGFCLNGSSGSFGTSSTSDVAITNLLCNITYAGRPGFVGMTATYSNGSPTSGFILVSGSGGTPLGFIKLKRDSTDIGLWRFGVGRFPTSLFMFDTGAGTGTHSYQWYASVDAGTTTIQIANSDIVGYEI